MKTTLAIFGVTGDLSRRKLLPAIEKIIDTGSFDDLRVVGISRKDFDIAELIGQSKVSKVLLHKIDKLILDVDDPKSYVKLKKYFEDRGDEQILVYLSVPPNTSANIIENLGKAGINGSNVKLLLEKPFGTNLESAQTMISHVASHYDEANVYRIDHYLAKEMSQNIIAFRGGNALFDHLWDNTAIEKIQVVAYEKIGIEGRAHFYEQAGALRDIVQGHLVQLLALMLMEVPQGLDWQSVPAARNKALSDIVPVNPDNSIRAQYATYREEVGNQGSMTETFVHVNLESTDPRWSGVKLELTTGKALNEKRTEIRVFFKKSHSSQTNKLVFGIQPEESVVVELVTKKPGYDYQFETQKLAFNYPEGTRLPEAYEQVIVDAIKSKKSLFAHSNEVLRSWEILKPLQDAWAKGLPPMHHYNSGSTASDIIAQ